jgi:hypothetical protein
MLFLLNAPTPEVPLLLESADNNIEHAYRHLHCHLYRTLPSNLRLLHKEAPHSTLSYPDKKNQPRAGKRNWSFAT